MHIGCSHQKVEGILWKTNLGVTCNIVYLLTTLNMLSWVISFILSWWRSYVVRFPIAVYVRYTNVYSTNFRTSRLNLGEGVSPNKSKFWDCPTSNILHGTWSMDTTTPMTNKTDEMGLKLKRLVVWYLPDLLLA